MASSHETNTPDFTTMTSNQEQEEIHEEPSAAMSQPTVAKQKRIRRCAGCHEPHSLHVWGLPSPHCPGHDQATADLLMEMSQLLSNSNASAAKSQSDSRSITSPGSMSFQLSSQPPVTSDILPEQLLLEQKFRDLQLEEERLTALSSLRAKIADKEAAITRLREAISSATTSSHATPQTHTELAGQPQHQPQPQQTLQATRATTTAANPAFQELGLNSDQRDHANFTIQDLRRQPLQELLSVSAPVGVPGQSQQPGVTRHHVPSLLPANATSLEERFMARPDAHADMFLSPSSVPQGEKALRIVDFLKNIVPLESEKTLSDMGGSRLVISYGQQRPRLESVTLSQRVVANTRIFHSLLFSHKLPTARDVRDYLAYTVKVMELAGKYEWQSVLKFDDDYRQLQASYSSPWSYDSPTCTRSPLCLCH